MTTIITSPQEIHVMSLLQLTIATCKWCGFRLVIVVNALELSMYRGKSVGDVDHES